VRVRSKQRTAELTKPSEVPRGSTSAPKQGRRAAEPERHVPASSTSVAVPAASAASTHEQSQRSPREHRKDDARSAAEREAKDHAHTAARSGRPRPPLPRQAAKPAAQPRVRAHADRDNSRGASDSREHREHRERRGRNVPRGRPRSESPASRGVSSDSCATEDSSDGGAGSDVDKRHQQGRRRREYVRPATAESYASGLSAPLSARERRRLEIELRRRRVHQRRLHEALALFGGAGGDGGAGAAGNEESEESELPEFQWSRRQSIAAARRPSNDNRVVVTPPLSSAGAASLPSGRPASSRDTTRSSSSALTQHRFQLQRVSREIQDIEALLSGRPLTADGGSKARRAHAVADAEPRIPATSPPGLSPRRHGFAPRGRGGGGAGSEHGANARNDARPSRLRGRRADGSDSGTGGTGTGDSRNGRSSQKPSRSERLFGTADSGSRPATAASVGSSDSSRPMTARDERLLLRRQQRDERHRRTGGSRSSHHRLHHDHHGGETQVSSRSSVSSRRFNLISGKWEET